ncbi:conserved hypothetical protein [Vibrio nigripulchritudo MADA3029]|uniref:DUF4426 domain-containing protein n=1 Tax=Vibrio nigripulchritudo SOn1 TaxID=1238450 RepID=A0AAV2VPH2_9VIBR|nr:DUF4426 domain-containing protein [Vibrio nigripulchritudo]CCN48075.1 conserved hypothetical protein [Vibrio nigripulchritudo MADA3020]CCN52550.1 conserved hypothetical protein [Vibrio nigripulchritudo MADA3021]CCN60053.1 conserved hypothetical protein [Vibrio nigripulchritudo MADA3029]CCO46534.1 conserved hypothetical protein [Vibrio nigripulchritudo SOn1]
MSKWLTALLALCLVAPVTAGQFKTIKNVEVHYSAFNTAFLTPKIARQYNLSRDGYHALLNISILDNAQVGKPAITAGVKGSAKNLLGQMKELTFHEVKEGNAIYYLAEFSISHEETFTFTIDIDAGLSGKGPIRFTQKFYVEE